MVVRNGCQWIVYNFSSSGGADVRVGQGWLSCFLKTRAVIAPFRTWPELCAGIETRQGKSLPSGFRNAVLFILGK